MASSKRILWGCFSNTVPSMVRDREAFDADFLDHGFENVFWCIGDTRRYPRLLPFNFPQGSLTASSSNIGWTRWLSDRYPNVERPQNAVAYLEQTFHGICDAFEPDVFVCWNRHDATFGIPFQIAKKRGIVTVDLERAIVPSYLSEGIDFGSQQLEYRDHQYQLGQEILERFPSANIYEQKLPPVNWKNGRPNLLILGSWTAVMDTSSCCFSSPIAMANYMEAALPNWNILLKPHPLDAAVGNFHRTSAANPVSLIKQADAVLTLGTKLELDVVQHGKPLVLANSGFLKGSGAAAIAATPEHCVELMRNVDTWADPEAAQSALRGYIGYKAENHWYSLDPAPQPLKPFVQLLAAAAARVAPTNKRSLYDACLANMHSVCEAKSADSLHRFNVKELAAYGAKRVARKLRSKLF